jgi:hypothetical protein
MDALIVVAFILSVSEADPGIKTKISVNVKTMSMADTGRPSGRNPLREP